MRPHKTALHETVQLCVSCEKHPGHSSFSASFPMEEGAATRPGLANTHGCPGSLPPPTPGQSHPTEAPQRALAACPEAHPDLKRGKSLGGEQCQAEQGGGKAYKNQRRRKAVGTPLLPPCFHIKPNCVQSRRVPAETSGSEKEAFSVSSKSPACAELLT